MKNGFTPSPPFRENACPANVRATYAKLEGAPSPVERKTVANCPEV